MFDTETTGLDVKKDEVLLLGAVAVEKGSIDVRQTFEAYLPLEEGAALQSADIHGVLPEKEATVPWQEALPAFLDYLNSSIIVGHNIDFDLRMLHKLLRRAGIKQRLRNKTLDTAQLAIRLDHPRGSHSIKHSEYTLDALCERYHIPLHDRHHATGDAFITAVLLLKLLAKLRKRGVVKTRDLLK